jgi:hypothetical protein
MSTKHGIEMWNVIGSNDALIFTLNSLVRLSHNHGKMQNTGRSYFAFKYSLYVWDKSAITC